MADLEPKDEAAALLEEIKKTKEAPLDDIAYRAEDGRYLSQQLFDNPFQEEAPKEGEATTSSPPAELPDTTTTAEIDSLINEIQDTQLEGNKSPQSLGSFNGLKTRYANSLAEFKAKVAATETRNAELAQQVEALKAHEEASTKLAELETKYAAAEAELADKRKENETLSYYRRKYDAESDPEIKRSYVDPMTELKRRSIEILEEAKVSPSFFYDLLDADSEAKLNGMIDKSNVSGLNAQALRQYVIKYSALDQDYNTLLSPENIEVAIAKSRGRSLQNADRLANDTFDSIKATFSEHVSELQESPENKEHNFYIHDQAVEKARTAFTNWRKQLGAEFQNGPILASLAQASFMLAAYPMKDKALRFYMDKLNSVLSEVRGNKPPPPKHKKEHTNGITSDDLQDLQKAAKSSIDDIAFQATKDFRR